MTLTPTEKYFLASLAKGASFGHQSFNGASPRIIRAEILRSLILEKPLDDMLYLMPRSGIILENVTIEGRVCLDNIDLVASGRIPSLTFKNCIFIGGFSANNADIVSLKFQRSLFSGDFSDTPAICLDNCKIGGTLNLNDIAACEPSMHCWVSARDALIDGSLLLTGANLSCAKREHLTSRQTPRYALNLLNAKINGDIEIKEGFIATGGITIRNSSVTGDVWLIGCQISSGEGNAIRAQGARINGSFVLRPAIHKTQGDNPKMDSKMTASHVDGMLDFWGANISGMLSIEGTKIVNTNNSKKGVVWAISLCRAQLGDGLCLKTFYDPKTDVLCKSTFFGGVIVDHAKITNSFFLSGVDIAGCKDNKHSLLVNNTLITGDFKLLSAAAAGKIYPCILDGGIQVHDSTIKGSVVFANAQLGKSWYSTLDFQRNECVGQVHFIQMDIRDDVCLKDSKFQSSLSLELDRHSVDTFIETRYCRLDLRNIRVTGDTTISADTKHFYIVGAVIENNLIIDAMISGDFYGSGVKVNGSLSLSNIRFNGYDGDEKSREKNRFIFTRSEITQSLFFNNPEAIKYEGVICRGMRTYPLLCYPNYLYCEADFEGNIAVDCNKGSVSFLIKNEANFSFDQLIVCNSNSSLFHSLNKQKEIDISTEEKAKDYLKLFCANIWGDLGAFVIFESNQHLPIHYLKDSKKGRNLDEICPIQKIDLTSPEAVKIDKDRKIESTDLYLFKTFMRYGSSIFLSYFTIKASYLIEMISEETVFEFDEKSAPKTIAPFRITSEYFTRKSLYTESDPPPDLLSSEQSLSLRTLLLKRLKIELKTRGMGDAIIDLSDTKVNQLIDDDGQAWGDEVTLKLTNFTYKRFNDSEIASGKPPSLRQKVMFSLKSVRASFVRDSGRYLVQIGITKGGNKCMSHRWAIRPLRFEQKPIKNRINQRLKWLNLQFDKPQNSKVKTTFRKYLSFLPFISFDDQKRKIDLWRFETFPYLHAASVFRKEGVHELARKIDYRVRKYSGLKYAKNAGIQSPIIYILHYLYQVSSRFGLSPTLAFTWLLLLILFGGIMTDVANHKGLMVVQTTTLTSSLETKNITYSNPLQAQSNLLSLSVACGDSVQPVLFAADIFLPLVDLGQEKKCAIGKVKNTLRDSKYVDGPSIYHWLRSGLVAATTSDISVWRWGRSFYTILGWIMLSLFIFALTNRLRLPENNR